MSDAETQFEEWFSIVVQRFGTNPEESCGDATPWESEWGQAALLEQFPPDGAGLELICDPHPHGTQVRERLLEVFAVAAKPADSGSSFERPEYSGTLSDAEAQNLLLDYAENMRKISELFGSEDGVNGAGNPPQLIRSSDLDNSYGLTVTFFSDMHEDVYADLSNPLFHLHEPLYRAGGCSFIIPTYVLWPAARGSSPLDDPFRSAFTLWKHGVDWAYPSDGIIHYDLSSDGTD